MDLLSLALAVALSAPPPEPKPIDFDEPINAKRSTINSAFLQDKLTAALALPYHYGVTQMPCRALRLQPLQGWTPSREPSGKIAWVTGAETSVKWAGMYGTCTIQSPLGRGEMSEAERSALECECNGWLPKGISEFPLP